MKSNKTLNVNGTPTKVLVDWKIEEYYYAPNLAKCSVTMLGETYEYFMRWIDKNSSRKGLIYNGIDFPRNEKALFSYILSNKK